VPPAPWRIWSALGLVYVFWGSTYLAIAYVVDTLPAFLSASLRFAVAGLILLAFLLVRRGRTALRATRLQLAWALGVGALLLLGGNGLVTLAEQRELPSGLAALLIAAVPLWVVLLRASAGDRPAGRTLLGVAIGFLGVAVLLLPGARPEGVALGAAAMVVLAGVLWSVGSFVATKVELPPDALLTAVVQMAGGSLTLAVAGLVRGETVDPATFSTTSVLAWGYLVVFGSLVAFTAYSWLLGVAPVSKVSTYAYVNPVVAVLLGAVIAGERITAPTVVGGAITVLAVAVVVSEEGRRRRAAVQGAPGALSTHPQAAGYGPDERQGRVRNERT
jgi:drug/metabolite transporter (DMT)-like permease